MSQPPDSRDRPAGRASTWIEPRAVQPPAPSDWSPWSAGGRPATLIESEIHEVTGLARNPIGPSPTSRGIESGSGLGARRAEPFRPVSRLSVAFLRVQDDDGSEGEVIRLRGDRFVIGRFEGDLQLPHDSRVSGRHVEITRREVPGGGRWFVTDLGSTNGLFVRVRRALLVDGTELLVGGARFRFEAPIATNPSSLGLSTADRGSNVSWNDRPESSRYPRLVEWIGSEPGTQTLLSDPETWIGTDPRCLIHRPDDPFCDPAHARVYPGPSGEWAAENNRSLNGLWVRVQEVEAVSVVHFQIGEQRFKLSVPPRTQP